MADLVADLLSQARSGLRVTLESNVLPAITVYGGEDSSPGVLSGVGRVLGIRAGLVVRNARGEVLARAGDPAPISWPRVAVLVTVVLGVTLVGIVAIRRAGRG